MKKYLTVQNIFIALMAIYIVFSIERGFKNNTSESTMKEYYTQKEKELKTENNFLKTKIHNYEINQLKIDAFIDIATDVQLDSLESVYNSY